MTEEKKEFMLEQTVEVLESIKDTCASQKACFGCPFCRYSLETAKNRDYYSASKLCSLIRTFCIIPRDIDLERLQALIGEGLK